MNPKSQPSTPSYTINCRMTQEAAALERLCQVVRIRGFRISKMAVESHQDNLAIALTLEGSRAIDMLQAQLEKLHTVAAVELIQSAVAKTAGQAL